MGLIQLGYRKIHIYILCFFEEVYLKVTILKTRQVKKI